MSKNRIIELLARKQAAEATPAELDELNALLARFPDAVYYEEFMDQIWTSRDTHTDIPDVDQAWQRHRLKFSNELTAEAAEPQKTWFGKYRMAIGIAATLILMVSAAIFYFSSREQFAPNTEIIAGKGVRKQITLPDGTKVWLNSDSKLSYDSDLKKRKKRIVYLTGEAFFDVAHDRLHPFIVKTDKICVKVLGTAFNVRAYPVDRKSETTLLRGSIELSVNERSGQKIILNPSEKFALVDNKHSEKISKPEADDAGREGDVTLSVEHIVPVRIGRTDYIQETSWRDSKLVFQNESLEELQPKLERWFNLKINFDNTQPKSYRFTGVFKDETIEETLKAMQLIKPFNFKLKAHDLTIY